MYIQSLGVGWGGAFLMVWWHIQFWLLLSTYTWNFPYHVEYLQKKKSCETSLVYWQLMVDKEQRMIKQVSINSVIFRLFQKMQQKYTLKGDRNYRWHCVLSNHNNFLLNKEFTYFYITNNIIFTIFQSCLKHFTWQNVFYKIDFMVLN